MRRLASIRISLLPVERIFRIRWFPVRIVEEVIVEVRQTGWQSSGVAEQVCKLFGDVSLIAVVIGFAVEFEAFQIRRLEMITEHTEC